MATPADGHKGYFQIGKAATWGTPATITNKWDFLDESIELDVDTIEDDALWGNVDARAAYQGSRFVKGSISFKVTFEGVMELLRGVLGTYPAPTTVETGVRDHLIKSGADTLPFYTGQIVKGNVPAGKCWSIDTFKMVSLSLEGSNQTGMAGVVKATLGIIGRDLDTNATPTAIGSFPSLFPVKFDQQITTDDGTADATADVAVRSWKLDIDQPHTDRERIYGALLISEPMRKGRPSYTWSMTQEFQTRTQLAALQAGTSGSPRFVYQHPTTIGVSSKREFELRMNEAKLISTSVPTPGPGTLIATSVWKAFYDATDTAALVARFRNTEVALP